MALGALGLYPAFDMECGWRFMGRTRRPLYVFIDGESEGWRGCAMFRQMDVSSICRMEMIPTWDGYAFHIWTCAFLARIANGNTPIPQFFEILIPEWWSPVIR